MPTPSDAGGGESPDGSDRKSVEIYAHPLTIWQRVWCGVIGVAVLAPAEAALFFGHDGSSIIGFTVVGGVALLFAAVGKLPARAKYKDLQVDMGRSERQIIDKLASAVPPQTIGQVLRESESIEGPVAQRLVAHALFESEMAQLVAEVAAKNDATVLEERVNPGEMRWDAIVRKNQISIYVEIKLRVDDATVAALLRRIDVLQPHTTIVVICNELTDSAYRRLEATNSIMILSPEPGHDLAAGVRQALDDLLSH